MEHRILNRDSLEREIELRDTIAALRRENGRLNAALAECHKEIFKLRDAFLSCATPGESLP